MNKDVEYQVTNDQIKLMVKDVQASQATTAGWLVGMDPEIINCKEVVDIISSFRQFYHLLIHVKLQQLCIKKKDNKLDWKPP